MNFVLTIVIFLSFSLCDAKESYIKVEVHIKDIRSIKIDLINNTPSVTRYWIFSCSWDESFVFNNKKLQLTLWECDKNIPKLIELAPGERISYNGTLGSSIDPEIMHRNDLKIGFILIKEKEVSFDYDLDKILNKKKLEMKDIVWSEPFQL